ncbi:MAG: hypothetical protein LC109_12590 [Bacteroidia bacterium]|nr:hypothetical protein [Bacteroidia bacterium]MCO5253792.1 hypothetical protein [Bacteroidota bacterium]MCZ2131086.1 hypothetical protein [Bacteroidia bacterium]
MKDELKANLITKYICGLCTPDEEEFIKNWLKTNSTNQLFLGYIKQNLMNSPGIAVVK